MPSECNTTIDGMKSYDPIAHWAIGSGYSGFKKEQDIKQVFVLTGVLSAPTKQLSLSLLGLCLN